MGGGTRVRPEDACREPMMTEPTAEQIAYLKAPVARSELLDVITNLNYSLLAVLELSLASSDTERRSALEELNKRSMTLSAMQRALLNAGSDPEWPFWGDAE